MHGVNNVRGRSYLFVGLSFVSTKTKRNFQQRRHHKVTAIKNSGMQASVIFNLMSTCGRKKKYLTVHRLKIHHVFYQVAFTLFKGGHVDSYIR